MISSRLTDIVFSIVLGLLGLYIAGTALGLGYLSNGTPAPGFFPLWIGAGLVVLSGWNILRALKAADRLPDISSGEALRVLVASAMMAAFIGLAYLAGMLVAIFVLMMAIGWLFGPRTSAFLLRLAALSAVMTGLIYLIFDRLLGVPGL